MPFDGNVLETAIEAFGSGKQSDDQVDGLLLKLDTLEATGHYGPLLNALSHANDEGNLRSLLLEATGNGIRGPRCTV